jgi:hypothetical protein
MLSYHPLFVLASSSSSRQFFQYIQKRRTKKNPAIIDQLEEKAQPKTTYSTVIVQEYIVF